MSDETLWQGRFDGDAAAPLRALSDSLSFDKVMYAQDIAGSRAHVQMLASVGILTGDEADEICAALDQVGAEIAAELAEGRFKSAAGDEDIHTHIERRVSEVTPAGRKMHTGRSRNDQVVTDLRLWTKDALAQTAGLVMVLQETLAKKAAQAGDAVLPGYTHMQHAQPVALAHHLLAHGWALSRDFERLGQAYARADVSALGAGALAGTSLPIDPAQTAEALGFSSVYENSLDAVSDRDFVLDALYALAVIGVHLSRIGEELVLWTTSEFSFVTLPDSYATGSSMMPQKKNPDAAELARGKAGRIIGHLTGMLVTLKGLPLAYSKDLQEDKEPLFDAFDNTNLVLAALNGMIEALEFDTEQMSQMASSPYLAATDLAEWLVQKGMAFRDAHGVVGEVVRKSLEDGISMRELVEADERLGSEAAQLLGDAGVSRTSHGGGSPTAVSVQLENFKKALETQQALGGS